jgi:hypothetical protein
VFFLLPQLPHTINLLIINRVSADKTAKHYRNITATLPQTLPQGEGKWEVGEFFRSPEDGSPEVQSLQ